jgi:hypothetical protein
MRYTVLNAADEEMLNEHFNRDIIEETQTRAKQPTGDASSERQMAEPLDNNSPPDSLKPKKKSRELGGLETSLGNASKPPAEGSHQNHIGTHALVQSAQLGLADEDFEDMIPIYAAAAISNNHHHEDGIDDPKSYKAATKSPLHNKWDTAMKDKLNGLGEHQVFEDFVKLPEGRKAQQSHWYARSSEMEQEMCSASRTG